ncbi:hypothetical protein ACFVH6_15045 [Spirillospora sp. NPDC127200]
MGKHRRLGGYRLLDEIGRGSTAVVHLAMDSFGREVAIKELQDGFAAEPEARQRLAQEMAAQARVRSGYAARLLDGRLDGERPYVVMQYVPGCCAWRGGWRSASPTCTTRGCCTATCRPAT